MNEPSLNVDLQTLRSFCEVAARSSFSQAAERMGVSQAAVSKSISRLETHLRVVLFKRSTRRIELTEDGRLFLPRVQRALGELDASFVALNDGRSEPTGLLRMTVLAPFARLHLVAPLADFIRCYPKVRLEVNFSTGREDLLTEGYDLSIGHPSAAKASYNAKLLCTWQYVLVASPAYLTTHGVPREPTDLLHHQCICPADSAGRVTPWEFVEMGNPSRRANHRQTRPGFIHIPTGPFLFTGQMEVMIEAAVAGLGISVVATGLAREALTQGRVKVVLPNWRMRSESDVLILFRHQAHLPLRLRLLIDHLIERVRLDDTVTLDAGALRSYAA